MRAGTQATRAQRRRGWLLAVLALVVALPLIGPYLPPLPPQPDVPPEALAGPGGQFVSVEGGRAYVVTAGPPTAQPVVLIHGLGGSTFSWRSHLPCSFRSARSASWRRRAGS